MATATSTNLALIAMGSAPAASAPAASFTNLIQALLGPSQTPAAVTPAAGNLPAPKTSEVDPQPPAPQTQPEADPVSPKQLAEAMIRTMLASNGNLAATASPAIAPVPTPAVVTVGTVPTTTPIKKSPTRPVQDSSSTTASQPVSVVPPAVMALAQSPLMRAPDATGKSSFAKLPFGAVIVPVTARNTTALAPLAFGMKLTPMANSQPAQVAAEPTPGPLPEAAPSESAPPTAALPAAVEVQAEPVEPQAAPEPSNPAAPSPGSVADSKIQKESATHADATPAIAATSSAAAATDNPGEFSRQLAQLSMSVAAAAGNPVTAKTLSSPVPMSAQPAREAEPLAPAVPFQQPAAPLKEIAVRIATPQAPAVDVHVAERAGQIHVAVRTADGGLQTSLRQDLGTLVNSLDRAGYRAEAFAPRDSTPSIATQTNFSENGFSQNSRQESESGSGERNGNFGDSSQNSGGGQQQQRRDPRQPKWIEELENQQ